MLENIMRCIYFVKDESAVQKWLKGRLSVAEVKSFVYAHYVDNNPNWRKLYDVLSDCVHTQPAGLGLLVDSSTENLRVKMAPILPDDLEEQEATLTPPIVFNAWLLAILQQAYRSNIKPNVSNEISKLLLQTGSQFMQKGAYEK
jgi:hypothetical protein